MILSAGGTLLRWRGNRVLSRLECGTLLYQRALTDLRRYSYQREVHFRYSIESQMTAGDFVSRFAFRLDRVPRQPAPSLAYSVLRRYTSMLVGTKLTTSLIFYIKKLARHSAPVVAYLNYSS